MSQYHISDDDDDVINTSASDPAVEDRGDIQADIPVKRKKNKIAIALFVFIIGIIAIAGFGYFIVSNFLMKSEVVAEPDPTLEREVSDGPGLITYQEELREAQRRAEERRLAEQREAERLEAERMRRELEAQARADAVVPMPPAAEARGQTALNVQDEPDPNAPEFRRLEGDVLIGVGGGGSIGQTSGGEGFGQPSEGLLGTGGAGSAGSAGSGRNGVTAMLQGGAYTPGAAWKQRGLGLMLRRGTNIPCVLQNRVVSTYPSLSSCVVTRDVYSADGSRVLIERNSVAYGEQSLTLTQGQARLFMTWNEIDTAGGIRVRLDSLATDSLGASGVDAFIDNHFWDRFGGAIMLSLIDDGLEVLANRLSDQNQQIGTNFSSSTNNVKNMAEIALEQSINIPPTGYVNQGELLNIRVARDVDFSSVYTVKGVHQ
ncbi:type IV secretion system protein VirB10 [Halomonas sp. 3D7M]|uniref:type IV secretion system protein VirB10 n=1 Tax=Halomonas sp. 3D7M TaxID=2742617 RepID=UPI0018684116|nr:type IV secretion system protein VirB10 [Halomonas sp. 3D7M]